MTPTGTPDDSAREVVRLPVRDVSEVQVRPRAVLATVTRLSGPTRPPATPDQAAAPDQGPGAPASDTDNDAVLALLHARLGYQAATAAAQRVRLPSLSDSLE